MMKPMMQWVKAAWWRGSAILVCALTMFTACSDNDDNPVTPDTQYTVVVELGATITPGRA